MVKYQTLELCTGLQFACPRCGGDDLTVNRVAILNPNERYIDLKLAPLLEVGLVDAGAPGMSLGVIPIIECAHCVALDDAPVTDLLISFDRHGRTRTRWQWEVTTNEP